MTPPQSFDRPFLECANRHLQLLSRGLGGVGVCLAVNDLFSPPSSVAAIFTLLTSPQSAEFHATPANHYYDIRHARLLVRADHQRDSKTTLGYK